MEFFMENIQIFPQFFFCNYNYSTIFKASYKQNSLKNDLKHYFFSNGLERRGRKTNRLQIVLKTSVLYHREMITEKKMNFFLSSTRSSEMGGGKALLCSVRFYPSYCEL
jgi:hypothetical protein